MTSLSDILSSPDFWKIAAPILGAVVAWFVNERHKRALEEYQRKESSYKVLLRQLGGFYVGADNARALKDEFLAQLTISWLYCPDDVIRKGYVFLATVNGGAQHSDQQKEAARWSAASNHSVF